MVLRFDRHVVVFMDQMGGGERHTQSAGTTSVWVVMACTAMIREPDCCVCGCVVSTVVSALVPRAAVVALFTHYQ